METRSNRCGPTENRVTNLDPAGSTASWSWRNAWTRQDHLLHPSLDDSPRKYGFRAHPETPTISKPRHFDGRTDGILFVEIFLSTQFQRLMRLLENRVEKASLRIREVLGFPVSASLTLDKIARP